MTTTSSPTPESVPGEVTATDPAAVLTPRQTVQAISGLMMGMFVAILAGTVVSTALPRIIHDLGRVSPPTPGSSPSNCSR
ncbi:hypothetical protein OG558_07755 [Kribbella sp. NBC_01510]|uniref:hypothetical protein n=1 Tax=Kribbella sp. NBC_01510 TaxID=2903581 RepID=UPI003866882D